MLQVIDAREANILFSIDRSAYLTCRTRCREIKYQNIKIINDQGPWSGQLYLTSGLDDVIIRKMRAMLGKCHHRRNKLIDICVEGSDNSTDTGIFIPLKAGGFNDSIKCLPRRIEKTVEQTVDLMNRRRNSRSNTQSIKQHTLASVS